MYGNTLGETVTKTRIGTLTDTRCPIVVYYVPLRTIREHVTLNGRTLRQESKTHFIESERRKVYFLKCLGLRVVRTQSGRGSTAWSTYVGVPTRVHSRHLFNVRLCALGLFY